jgi:hypothetical protein
MCRWPFERVQGWCAAAAVRAAPCLLCCWQGTATHKHSCATQCHYTCTSRATAAPQPWRRRVACCRRCCADAVLPAPTAAHHAAARADKCCASSPHRRVHCALPQRGSLGGAAWLVQPAPAVAHARHAPRAARACLRSDQKRVKPASSTTMCKPGKRAGVRRRGGRPACRRQGCLLSVARHCTHPLAGPAASGRAQHALSPCSHSARCATAQPGTLRAHACRLQNSKWQLVAAQVRQ